MIKFSNYTVVCTLYRHGEYNEHDLLKCVCAHGRWDKCGLHLINAINYVLIVQWTSHFSTNIKYNIDIRI